MDFKAVWLIAVQGLKKDLRPALKHGFLPCFFATLILTSYSYFAAAMNPQETTMMLYKGVEILFTIFVGILYSLFLVRALRAAQIPLTDHMSDHFKQTMIETIRTLPHIMAYSILLVVPGIIKMVQLSFVPMIVQRTKSYQKGEVDALTASAELARGHLFPMTVIWVIFQGLILFFQLGLPSILSDVIGWEGASVSRMIVEFAFILGPALILEIACFVVFHSFFEAFVKSQEGKYELAF